MFCHIEIHAIFFCKFPSSFFMYFHTLTKALGHWQNPVFLYANSKAPDQTACLFRLNTRALSAFKFSKFAVAYVVSLEYQIQYSQLSLSQIQGILWNNSRYPYVDISDLQNWGKINGITAFSNEYVIWLLKLDILKILWKRKEIAP